MLKARGVSNRAVITGDLLRAEPDFLFLQSINVRWFASVILGSVRPLFDHIEIIGEHQTDGLFPTLFRELYREPGLHVYDEWAAVYRQDLPDAASEVILDALHGSTVFLFEASPSLMRLLDANGIGYVNAKVHPLRFAADLILSFESNDPLITSRLQGWTLSADVKAMEANACRSRFMGKAPDLPADSLIFLGQVRYDSSLIKDGRFSRLDEHADAIREIAGDRPVFHKPHPHDPDGDAVVPWLDLVPRSRLLTESVYSTFSTFRQHSYITLSSGAGYEARLLHHETHFLLPDCWPSQGDEDSGFSNILQAYWRPSFWRSVLFGDDNEPYIEAAFVPDRLRQAVRCDWAPVR